MLWMGLLSLLLVSELGPLRSSSPFTTGCQDNDPRYTLTVESLVTVQEGLCVLVPCKFSHPYSSYSTFGFWFQKEANTEKDFPVTTNNPDRDAKKDTQGRFYLLGDLKNGNCSLDIRDIQRGDNGSYFFRVEKGKVKWNYCGNPVSVHVTALTHTPHLNIPQTLDPGHPSNLTCSVPWACERATPPIFSWMSSALTSLGPRTTHSSVLILTPQPQDHGTNLTCQVTFPGAGVTVERTVQLNVTTGNLRTKAVSGVVLGALGGAGVTALLAFCLCLIFFIVKWYRKKAARATMDMNHIPQAMGPSSQGHKLDSKLHRPSEPSSSSEETPTMGMEQGLHYATLNFHRMRPQEDTF